MASVPLMGFEGYLYVGAAEADPTLEVKNCRSLALGASFTEVDTTVQGNRGIKSYSKGLQDFVISWSQVVCATPEEGDSLIMEAIASRTPVTLWALEKNGGQGPKGVFHLFGGEQTVDGDSVQVIPVTARPATGYDAPSVASKTN